MTEGPSSAVFRDTELAPGLYLVATPIGAARDITLRALDILASADILAAEDTRTLRHLMDLHSVPLKGRRVLPYHDHNGPAQRPRLMALLGEGKSIAYCSDAGTPLVADPGYRLATEAMAAGLPVHTAPGPSAALAALTLSGLPTDRFLFAGFPPTGAGARAAWLEEILAVQASLVLFEAPRRVGALLAEIAEAGHGARPMALCRELTKRFEEVRRGPVAEIAAELADVPPKGELVIVLGPPLSPEVDETALRDALEEAMGRLKLKEASAEVAARLGMRKRDVYQLGLSLKETNENGGE